MSDSETKGRCYNDMKVSRDFATDHLVMADAIDRLAADVAEIKAKTSDIEWEAVQHFVESEKAWVKLVEEQRDAAIRERDEWREEARLAVVNRDEARAEVARLRGEVEDGDRLIDQLIVGNEALARERDEARAEVERLRSLLPPTAHLGVRNGPGEGAWSVFACKVVEERDEARAEVERLKAELAAPHPAAPPPGWLTEEVRKVIILADSELSAIGHHRPPDKEQCLRLSADLRRLWKEVPRE